MGSVSADTMVRTSFVVHKRGREEGQKEKGKRNKLHDTRFLQRNANKKAGRAVGSATVLMEHLAASACLVDCSAAHAYDPFLASPISGPCKETKSGPEKPRR